MNLTDIPMGEVVRGIEKPMPRSKKARSATKWARFKADMKIGDCVRVADVKEKDAMKSYFRANKVGCQTLAVGDGSFVVWRTRWASK
jgi:hypothetical protein